MNIHPVAIVGNQCDRNSVEEFGWNGHSVSTFSVTAWQGVP